MTTKKVLFALLFLMLTGVELFAAGGPPGPPTGPPPCWPPPCIPIDGGISLLLAAGALYGGKKLYDSRKSAQAEP